MWEVVKELRQLMKDIPMYSSHFMSVLNEVMMGYRDSLRLLYKGCLLFILHYPAAVTSCGFVSLQS